MKNSYPLAGIDRDAYSARLHTCMQGFLETLFLYGDRRYHEGPYIVDRCRTCGRLTYEGFETDSLSKMERHIKSLQRQKHSRNVKPLNPRIHLKK